MDHLSMDHLKSAVKKHYKNIELTPEQLERLNQPVKKTKYIF